MARPPQQYHMNDTNALAQQASEEITNWLISRQQQGLNQINNIENVEDNPAYQALDIDLLVNLNNDNQFSIEIKADRYHTTGNFFFETVSNLERNTEGCFLYTQANYIFYYFIEIQRLYVLTMPEVRNWFVEHQEEFRQVATQTNVGNGNYYTTVGKLVPITIIEQQIPNYIYRYELGN